MAAKYLQDPVQGQPLAPSSITPRSDAENPNNHQYSEHLRNKKKRTKFFASVAVIALSLIALALILALTLGPVRSPKVRLEDVVVTSNTPGGDLRFAARVLIKNRNFVRYRFDDTYATVRSGNSNVGQFLIEEGRARARSTKRRAVVWDMRAQNGSSGSLDLTVEAEVRGRMQVVRVIKRRKSGRMNCTMSVDLASRSVQNLRCR